MLGDPRPGGLWEGCRGLRWKATGVLLDYGNMPQPTQINPDDIRWQNGEMLERPEHAQQLALISCNWTRVERALAALLGALLHTGYGGSVEQRIKQHEKNSGLLNAVVNTPTKIEMILEAARYELSEDTLKKLRALVEKVQTRSKERNTVIHAVWGVCDIYPNDLILIPKVGQPRDKQVRYSKRDFENIVTRLNELREELNDFKDTVWAEMFP